MASPTFFNDGHTPNRNDPTWKILQKILGATIDGGGGGGGATQVFNGHYGAGTPGVFPGTSAAVAYNLDAPFQEFKWDPDTATWT